MSAATASPDPVAKARIRGNRKGSYRRIARPFAFLVILLMVVAGSEMSAVMATEYMSAQEAELGRLLNQERARQGLQQLAHSDALRTVARRHSQRMMVEGYIFHNASVANEVEALFPDWASLGENVGVSPSVPSVHTAFMNSPLHRENILHPTWGHMGIGVVSGGTRLFFTQNFLTLKPGARRPAPTALRLSGADRIHTGRVIADFGFDPGSARGAVVADAYTFHDALAGTSLAASVDGPTVLTSTEQLDTQAAMALDRALGPNRSGKTVYLVGGPFAPKVRDSLEDLGVRVEEIGNGDPIATAAAVARALPQRPNTAFITTVGGYPDALAVSAVSAVTGWPVLYTDPGGLSGPTADVLEDLGIDRTFVLGGPLAVSDRVVSQLFSTGARPASRLAGASRIETSLAIANFAEANGLLNARQPQIATGYNFPDALAGGALANVLRSPVLLTTSDRLHPSTSEWLRTRRDQIHAMYILGGSAAVSTAIETDLAAALA